MSLINVTNITVGNNVCPVTSPLVFQIEFECLEDLKNDVEWKIIYVTSDGTGYVEGNRQSADMMECRDGEIVLDAVCLGPVYRGILEFEFRVAPPDFSRMNPHGILGMQAILVTASYCDQEFIRIGYYTNNCYDDHLLRECPPDEPIIEKMVRCIIEEPRVTRFPIRWDGDTLVDPEGNDLSSVIHDGVSSDEDKAGEDEAKEPEDANTAEDKGVTSDNAESVSNAQQDTTAPEIEGEKQLSCDSVKRTICEVGGFQAEGESKLRCVSKLIEMPTCTSISDV
ncbi:anti-silencing protein, ASF1-like family protein [Babesia divergens]|uniref:Anti-silencing protein, ASF1-like family protein n=1 Tax=Babesia divergens TaxID=32595 RepID=A0AAD9LHW1_BABDI|nr:anti-silencing protein, ASF1-like family protein [Babesia divergens]